MDRESIDLFYGKPTRKRPKPMNWPGMRTVCDKRSSSFRLPTELATGVIAIFAMLLAVMIMGPVAALERPLPLLPLATTFNDFQGGMC
jgi:hypothetical protein